MKQNRLAHQNINLTAYLDHSLKTDACIQTLIQIYWGKCPNIHLIPFMLLWCLTSTRSWSEDVPVKSVCSLILHHLTSCFLFTSVHDFLLDPPVLKLMQIKHCAGMKYSLYRAEVSASDTEGHSDHYGGTIDGTKSIRLIRFHSVCHLIGNLDKWSLELNLSAFMSLVDSCCCPVLSVVALNWNKLQ